MKKWKAWLGIALVFFLGFIIGGLFVHVAYQRGIRRAMQDPTQAVADRLTRALKLNADQRQQLESIVEEAKQQIEPIRDEVRPRIEKIIAKAEGRLEKILTPEQLAKFEKIKAARAKSLPPLNLNKDSGTQTAPPSEGTSE